MHLSKLTLDPRHAQAQMDLGVPYELHRTLGRAFPDAEADSHRARHGVLFRIEEAMPAGVPVLVQSATRPDWGLLPTGYARRVDGPKAVDPALAAGQRLRFRLVANPVRRTHSEGKKNPTRLALVHPRGMPEGQDGPADGYLDWLGRQGARHGFAVADVADVPFRLAPRRPLGAALGKGAVPHFGVRFDGVLTVTDAEALAEALRSGIGSARAFGFGLLSLAPDRESG